MDSQGEPKYVGTAQDVEKYAARRDTHVIRHKEQGICLWRWVRAINKPVAVELIPILHPVLSVGRKWLWLYRQEVNRPVYRKHNYKPRFQSNDISRTNNQAKCKMNYCPTCDKYPPIEHECVGNKCDERKEARLREDARLLREASLILSDPSYLTPSAILRNKGGYDGRQRA